MLTWVGMLIPTFVMQFNPDKWADIMKDAGMKYMIFTTKHHDGFCMFDSKYTDFSIANGPFANNPKKDVARYVFDAFRQKDFMIGYLAPFAVSNSGSQRSKEEKVKRLEPLA